MSIHVGDPVLDDALRSTYFFNGRLLSAEDLNTEQEARRTVDGWLGEAIGTGVVWGYGVEKRSQSVLQISAGRAVNRLGQVLHLPATLTLELNPTLPLPTSPSTSAFDECSTVSASLPAGLSRGVFVLCVAPAQGQRGSAPTSGLNGGGACNAKYRLDGVRFRLVRLQALDDNAGVLDDLLRNRVAHRSFGTDDEGLQRLLADPFGPALEEYGLLNRLLGGRDPEISFRHCDVPLAALLWKRSGELGFVDVWSVRRRPHFPALTRWTPLLSGRREVEAEARLAQFQDHISDLIGSANTETARASTYFDYLPPVGVLPLGAGKFAVRPFFAGSPDHPGPAFEDVSIETAEVPAIIARHSLSAPISTRNWPPVIRIYRSGKEPSYIVFARGETPNATIPVPGAAKGRLIITLIDARSGKPILPQNTDLVATRIWVVLPDGGRVEAVPTPVPVNLSNGPYRPCLPERAVPLVTNAVKAIASTRLPDTAGGIRFEDMRPASVAPTGTAPEAVQLSDRVIFSNQGLGMSGWDNPAFDIKVPVPTVPRSFAYVAEGLPAGTLTIRGIVPGYPSISQQVELTEDQQKPVRVCCFFQSGPSPFIHGLAAFPGQEWRDPQGKSYSKLVLPELVQPGRKPDWGEPTPPPPDWTPLLEAALQSFLDEHPEAAFSPHRPGLLVDPAYQPGTVSDQPYAYLVTTDGSALPVILTPPERTLPAAVNVRASGIPELADQSRLRDSVLADADVFAGAWSGVVAEALGVSPASARSLIEDSQGAVLTIRESRTYFAGLTASAAVNLATKNLGTDIDLANAAAPAVKAALGDGYTLGYAARLIEQARQVIPASSWSVKAVGLNLSDLQLSTATSAGIASLGDLQRALKTPSSRSGLQITLSMSNLTFNALKTAVLDAQHTAVLVARPDGALTDLGSVDATMAGRLVAGGIATVSLLAGSDPATLAPLLGLSDADAAAVVKEAAVTVLVSRVGVKDEATASKLFTEAGAENLKDVLSRIDAGDQRLTSALKEDGVRNLTLLGKLGGLGP